jgi:hypothetical protein
MYSYSIVDLGTLNIGTLNMGNLGGGTSAGYDVSDHGVVVGLAGP